MVEQTDELIRPWATAMRTGRPHVIVKWATSLDGRTAAHDGSSKWISGHESREDSHLRRSNQDAILVGTATILADDAELTARYADGTYYEHQPLRVVLGESELPPTARVFNDRAETVQLATRDIKAALHELFDRGVRRLWVEGGPTVASAFLREGLFDELVIYVAPLLLGGERVATTDIGIGSIAEAKNLRIVEHRRLGDDILIRALPKESH
jgi:diaminohydroxyphosphoribosylaminopyrimidine deaminase/5-amino-6-(5-phosphoribosylamino)uracil reductase